MKNLLTMMSLFLLLAAPSMTLAGDYLGTYCWLDDEGNTLELIVSTIGDGASYSYTGLYHTTSGYDSPVLGALTPSGSDLVGTFTSTERLSVGDDMYVTDFNGNIRISLSDFSGSLWGIARASNVSTSQTTLIAATNDITLTTCAE